MPRKARKAGKFLAFYRTKSRNFSFFRKFPYFSHFSMHFLAFLHPRNLIKKESVAPRKKMDQQNYNEIRFEKKSFN